MKNIYYTSGILKFGFCILYFAIFLFSTWGGYRGAAQQLPYYSQYMYSAFYINPAVAGSREDIIPVMMTFRRQWAGFDDAPLTNTISGHAALIKNMGFGAILLDDRTGPLHQTGAQFTYAYHIKLKEDMKLGFGLGGMVYQHVLNKGNFTILDQNDNVIRGGKEKVVTPDATFGIYFRTNRFFAGFSSPQLIENNMRFDEYADLRLKMVRHYFLYSGYRIVINDEMEIIPSALLKFVDGAPFQFDGNIRYDYKSRFWCGFSYRDKESVIGLAGFRAGNFAFGYSYDFTISNIKKYSSGSHEIFISFDVTKKRNKSVASFD
ncbi:MAG: type IX secretion system membrane protein PorP/SprF [Bacteroidetes bacterium]|nr:type IX secretion system membrane protein PorP/SprF [Bacteroidota bacterium]